ncbi:MAG: SdrD B-like domain-containing protein [Candidatus Gracilibacteria bacterium]|nr:SdrD B-like domain-containing protein [Candidatus Gracilibacteria bacterium]
MKKQVSNTFSGTSTAGYSSGSYIETVNINLNALDNEGGSGIDQVYYALGTNTGTLEYTSYSGAIIINGLGDYTLNYYSVDKFGNVEENKTISFTLTERPETYSGKISGFVYDDNNNNGIQETTEKLMAGWKVCIDKNNNGTCEENSEPFILTNNDGHYEFNGLPKGLYKIIEIPHQNWNITSPTNLYYDVNLGIGQEIVNINFGNYKYKGNSK